MFLSDASSDNKLDKFRVARLEQMCFPVPLGAA